MQKLTPQQFVIYSPFFSFFFSSIYIFYKVYEENPKRFYKQHYNYKTKLMSKRFDFGFVLDILKKAFYFASMLFVILSIIIYLICNLWPCEIKTTMGVLGFNVVVVFFYVIQDVYDFVQDNCEDMSNFGE